LKIQDGGRPPYLGQNDMILMTFCNVMHTENVIKFI